MTSTLAHAAKGLADQPKLVYFDPDLIVSPKDNPVPTPAKLASLLPSIQEFGQKVPGFVCPMPDLPDDKRLCLEGNHRLEVARLLNLPFWAFDVGRAVAEEERIRLTFLHNHSRRAMTPVETADKATRFMELTGCTAEAAATLLHVSPATLSRAFGEGRIRQDLKVRAETLGISIRAMVGRVRPDAQGEVVDFALTPGPDGRLPTRDDVTLFIRRLKKPGKPKVAAVKVVTLRHNGRTITLTVGDRDNVETVTEDLKTIAGKLTASKVAKPDGWPFLFS